MLDYLIFVYSEYCNFVKIITTIIWRSETNWEDKTYYFLFIERNPDRSIILTFVNRELLTRLYDICIESLTLLNVKENWISFVLEERRTPVGVEHSRSKFQICIWTYSNTLVSFFRNSEIQVSMENNAYINSLFFSNTNLLDLIMGSKHHCNMFCLFLSKIEADHVVPYTGTQQE